MVESLAKSCWLVSEAQTLYQGAAPITEFDCPMRVASIQLLSPETPQLYSFCTLGYFYVLLGTFFYFQVLYGSSLRFFLVLCSTFSFFEILLGTTFLRTCCYAVVSHSSTQPNPTHFVALWHTSRYFGGTSRYRCFSRYFMILLGTLRYCKFFEQNSSSIFTFPSVSSSVTNVTSYLFSTLWRFRPYKPNIFGCWWNYLGTDITFSLLILFHFLGVLLSSDFANPAWLWAFPGA